MKLYIYTILIIIIISFLSSCEKEFSNIAEVPGTTEDTAVPLERTSINGRITHIENNLLEDYTIELLHNGNILGTSEISEGNLFSFLDIAVPDRFLIKASGDSFPPNYQSIEKSDVNLTDIQIRVKSFDYAAAITLESDISFKSGLADILIPKESVPSEGNVTVESTFYDFSTDDNRLFSIKHDETFQDKAFKYIIGNFLFDSSDRQLSLDNGASYVLSIEMEEDEFEKIKSVWFFDEIKGFWTEADYQLSYKNGKFQTSISTLGYIGIELNEQFEVNSQSLIVSELNDTSIVIDQTIECGIRYTFNELEFSSDVASVWQISSEENQEFSTGETVFISLLDSPVTVTVLATQGEIEESKEFKLFLEDNDVPTIICNTPQSVNFRGENSVTYEANFFGVGIDGKCIGVYETARIKDIGEFSTMLTITDEDIKEARMVEFKVEDLSGNFTTCDVTLVPEGQSTNDQENLCSLVKSDLQQMDFWDTGEGGERNVELFIYPSMFYAGQGHPNDVLVQFNWYDVLNNPNGQDEEEDYEGWDCLEFSQLSGIIEDTIYVWDYQTDNIQACDIQFEIIDSQNLCEGSEIPVIDFVNCIDNYNAACYTPYEIYNELKSTQLNKQEPIIHELEIRDDNQQIILTRERTGTLERINFDFRPFLDEQNQCEVRYFYKWTARLASDNEVFVECSGNILINDNLAKEELPLECKDIRTTVPSSSKTVPIDDLLLSDVQSDNTIYVYRTEINECTDNSRNSEGVIICNLDSPGDQIPYFIRHKIDDNSFASCSGLITIIE